GPHIKTMWGLLAWQIGPEAYAMVEANDQDRVAPGGDLIRSMLTKGAGGRPVLLLLDEVLKYVERAAAVPVHESTLQRQSKDFFQSLTVEVAGSERAVMVYSLQWSKKEALGNVALLQELDMLANRVDQLREPVTGDEILPILHRRLLGAAPDPAAASQVAQVYQAVFTKMRRANASDESQKHVADEEGHRLFERLRAGYPFHPALIDLMRERWTAVEDFQRTRGSPGHSQGTRCQKRLRRGPHVRHPGREFEGRQDRQENRQRILCPLQCSAGHPDRHGNPDVFLRRSPSREDWSRRSSSPGCDRVRASRRLRGARSGQHHGNRRPQRSEEGLPLSPLRWCPLLLQERPERYQAGR